MFFKYILPISEKGSVKYPEFCEIQVNGISTDVRRLKDIKLKFTYIRTNTYFGLLCNQ